MALVTLPSMVATFSRCTSNLLVAEWHSRNTPLRNPQGTEVILLSFMSACRVRCRISFFAMLFQMYIMLNIRIVLVGLEIWTAENKISIDGGAADVLANFVQWREQDLVSRRRHDSAQLVL